MVEHGFQETTEESRIFSHGQYLNFIIYLIKWSTRVRTRRFFFYLQLSLLKKIYSTKKIYINTQALVQASLY
ncbi:hypothetical protein ACJX0J_009661, partial [Zea mays]